MYRQRAQSIGDRFAHGINLLRGTRETKIADHVADNNSCLATQDHHACSRQVVLLATVVSSSSNQPLTWEDNSTDEIGFHCPAPTQRMGQVRLGSNCIDSSRY